MTRTRNVRTGFTLVELLAAMGVIIVLAGIAAMVVPAAVTQDRTTDAAGLTRLYLTQAKNRAARDGLPRGLRFIVAADPTIPTKSPLWVTEMQEIESPVVYVANGNQTTRFDTTRPPVLVSGVLDASPVIDVIYSVNASGTITGRAIFLRNIPSDQVAQIQSGGTLGVPEFNGYWARILTVSAATATGPNTSTVSITVDTFPDDYMGASQEAISYRFGIYALPQTLMASTTLPLPKNICVDLNVSVPPWSTGSGDYDVLFAPNGQVINGIGRPVTQGQMFLWVRDYTKAANPLSVLAVGPPTTFDVNVFRTAGEQQIVALKTKSGAMGVFPVTWPVEATGQYAAGQDPFSFARLGATGP